MSVSPLGNSWSSHSVAPLPKPVAAAETVETPYASISLPPASLGEGLESLSSSLGMSTMELVERLTNGRGLADVVGTGETTGRLLDGYA